MNDRTYGEAIFDQTELLSGLQPAERHELRGRIERRTAKKGHHLFRAGDEALAMYIVKSGSMKITMDLTDGREQILYIYHEEEFVGGLNLLTSDRYHYSGVALTDMTYLALRKDDFDRILCNNPAFLRGLLRESFHRIRKSEELIDRLSGISADEKVAKTILSLVSLIGEKGPDGLWEIDSALNRTEFGSFTGLARETLTRKLTALQDEGTIRLGPKGRIKILDMQALVDKTL